MSQIKDTKCLVVGGAGFVGSNLVKELLAQSAEEVWVVDNLLSAEATNVPDDPRVVFIDKSINDEEDRKYLPIDFDYAFHLATFHGNQNSIYDPIADHENNALPCLTVFHWLSTQCKKLKKVVYSSAGCTVAEKTFDKANATTEESPVSLFLDSPYQISKVIGEFYGNFYWKQFDLPIVKARFQNVYGPGEILGAGQWRGTEATIWRNVTPTFVYQSLKGMALSVENGGIATRDFIYVQDIVDGLIRCATKGVEGGTYNLASGDETSILDLAKLINELTNNHTKIALTPKRDWDRSGKRYGSTDKAKNDLGFEAKTNLRQGLEQTIAWTKENLSIIEACMSKHQSRIATAA